MAEFRELKGTVRDDQGAPISGAVVTATATDGTSQVINTGATGQFDFTALPLKADGDYQLTIKVGEITLFVEATDKVVYDTVAAKKFVLTNGLSQTTLTATNTPQYHELLKVALTTAQLQNAQGNTDGQLHIDNLLSSTFFFGSKGCLPEGVTNDALLVSWYIRVGNGSRVLPLYDDAELTRPKLWYQAGRVIEAGDLQNYYYDLDTSGSKEYSQSTRF